ncbi:MAG: hypothetical protein ACJ8GN_02285 [Longimicrobiaceae bacterium]
MRSLSLGLVALLAYPCAVRAQKSLDCGSFDLQIRGAETRSLSGWQATFDTAAKSMGIDLRTHGSVSTDSVFVVYLSRHRDTVEPGTARISAELVSPTEFTGTFLRAPVGLRRAKAIVAYNSRSGRLRITRASDEVIEGSFAFVAVTRPSGLRVNARGAFRAVRRNGDCRAAAQSTDLIPSPRQGR